MKYLIISLLTIFMATSVMAGGKKNTVNVTSVADDADAGCEIQYVELIEESDEDDGFSYETVIESKYPEQIVENVAPELHQNEIKNRKNPLK